MTGLLTTLVLLAPAALVVWLLLKGPLGRDPELRLGPPGRRRRGRPEQVRRRVYRVARLGRGQQVTTVDGRRTWLTVEPVGVVVPEVPFDPGGMVPAAGHAMVESRAMAAAEQSPAYRAAAASPASQAAAGTPLAEDAPMLHDD
jgi:hypothetical protein